MFILKSFTKSIKTSIITRKTMFQHTESYFYFSKDVSYMMDMFPIKHYFTFVLLFFFPFFPFQF